jgi:hypothetical protein
MTEKEEENVHLSLDMPCDIPMPLLWLKSYRPAGILQGMLDCGERYRIAPKNEKMTR